jgi:hypothetical protein
LLRHARVILRGDRLHLWNLLRFWVATAEVAAFFLKCISMNTNRFLFTYCVFALEIFGLSACSSSGNLREEFQKADYISIAVPPNTEELFNFELYVDSVTIIPLETTDESLIRRAYDIIYQNDKVYIFDKFTQELHVFRDDGSFVFNLNKRGRGPEEYLEMRDVEVDENGNIYVLSSQKIHIYDSLRRLLRTIPFSLLDDHGVSPTGFAFAFDEGYYLYAGAFGLRAPRPDRFAVYKVNSEGVFEGKGWFPVINNGSEFPRFFKLVDDRTYIFAPPLGNDTLYRFEADAVYPAYYLDYGDRKLPREYYEGFGLGKERSMVASRENYVRLTQGVIETSTMLSYQFRARNNNLWFAFYSKQSSKSICFPYFKDFGVKDYFPILRSGVGNKFSGHIDAHQLIASRLSGQFKRHFGYLDNFNELDAAISLLNDNDNPVLMTVTFKDF